MAYVKCSDCNTAVHVKPVDVTEFLERFEKGKEDFYCLKCWKKKQANNTPLDQS